MKRLYALFISLCLTQLTVSCGDDGLDEADGDLDGAAPQMTSGEGGTGADSPVENSAEDASAPSAADAQGDDASNGSRDAAVENDGDAPDANVNWQCSNLDGGIPEFLPAIGCASDFSALAADESVKTVVDRDDDNRLYFQNSRLYSIHHAFVSEHASGPQGLPLVPTLAEFNRDQYTSPSRRFLLGAVTRYGDNWVYELAPYDTATAEMIATAFEIIRAHHYAGASMRFHITSEAIAAVALDLPSHVPTVETQELIGGGEYQGLNVAESVGRLTFVTAAELEAATSYVSFRDIAVLDYVPNDISVTLGIITSQFQTPLAHINVLAKNRGIPNMALKGAYENEQLRALEGKWVRLEVGLNDYSISEVTKEDADDWWEENGPEPVTGVPGIDLNVTDMVDMDTFIELEELSLYDAVKTATRSVGGKAGHYAALTQIEGIRVPDAFAVPVYYYFQFMEENGFDAQVEAMLADAEFQDSPEVRDTRLAQLRDAMQQAPVNAEFEQLLLDKLNSEYAGMRMRFRSSTNAEDLDGFTGAGLYESKSGDPNDPTRPVLDAVRDVWSSVWLFRAFEERSFRSIDHLSVGMALLVHQSFPDEEANGVALTHNPFDPSGLDPAFYVNVQLGDESVVLPPEGTTTEQFLYYYDTTGQPVSYYSYSSLAGAGDRVLTQDQVEELGDALDKIRNYFAPAYAPGLGANPWWAMDVEFKFDQDVDSDEIVLWVKQARPFGN
jgi:pyruvate, water dikinase